MTVFNDVRALIDRLAPEPQDARAAGSNGFELRKDICSMCSAEKLVIRRVK